MKKRKLLTFIIVIGVIIAIGFSYEAYIGKKSLTITERIVAALNDGLDYSRSKYNQEDQGDED